MDSAKLKYVIERSGFTQTRLAYELGMSKNTLNLKVNGKLRMNIQEAEMICTKLGITDPHEKADIFLK